MPTRRGRPRCPARAFTTSQPARAIVEGISSLILSLMVCAPAILKEVKVHTEKTDFSSQQASDPSEEQGKILAPERAAVCARLLHVANRPCYVVGRIAEECRAIPDTFLMSLATSCSNPLLCVLGVRQAVAVLTPTDRAVSSSSVHVSSAKGTPLARRWARVRASGSPGKQRFVTGRRSFRFLDVCEDSA